jgi:ketopantoate reductase
MEKKMKVTIIGNGGLGANLAILLSEQGHEVSIVDGDHADDKFFDRFVFFNQSRVIYQNSPKVHLTQLTAKYRGKRINAYPVMADEKFDFQSIADQMVIIAVDTAQARELIEAKLRTAGCNTYIHVGCNLNSVSVFSTMRRPTTGQTLQIGDTVSTDPPADAQTSYDVVPDAKTYLRAAVEVASYLDQPVRMWIDEEIGGERK